MKNHTVRRLLALGVVSASVWFMGCGGNGASNNDQGVSVTFLGFFPTTTTGCTGPQTGLARATMRLGEYAPEPAGETGVVGASGSTGTTGPDASSSYIASVGVQNNLYGQFFRGDRVLLEYYIPGASIQPPPTNVAVNMLAGPPATSTTGSTTTTGGGLGTRQPVITALPPSFSSGCNKGYSAVAIVPAAVREWLNFNRGSLPEPPYSMEVYATVTGLSSSGDRIDTNTQGIEVDVLPEVFISGADESSSTSVTGEVEGSSVTQAATDGSSDGASSGTANGGL